MEPEIQEIEVEAGIEVGIEIARHLLNGQTLIKSWRMASGLSKKEVADKLGISQSDFSKIESSANPPNETRKVADALGIDVVQLVL